MESMDVFEVIDYVQLEGVPAAGVNGHEGKLVYGSVGGVDVVAAQGRCHLYEGFSPKGSDRDRKRDCRIGSRTGDLDQCCGFIE